MRQNKSRDKSPDLTFEEELNELADAITENKEGASSEASMMDPFESYVDSMRSKIYTDHHLFRSRFSKGYQLLLQTIEHDHEHLEK